jgi:large subunit ribosomal protein L15
MKLNEISDRPGARYKAKRVGRGIGSGKGKTAGRGVKGQKSREGVAIKGFEGGQMPIHRRLPKRGFHNPSARRYAEIGLDDLQAAVDGKKLDASKPITGAMLKEAGLLTHLRDGVRILGNGTIKAKLTVEVSGATRSAIAAIEGAGGSIKVDVLPGTRQKRPPKGSRGRKMLRAGRRGGAATDAAASAE